MTRPRCSRCGRPLTDPVSIARGMGPVCAGSGGTGRRPPHTRAFSGTRYAVFAKGCGQEPPSALTNGQAEPVKLSRRARLAAARKRRRQQFQCRLSFRCGLNGRTRERIVYSPTPDWQEHVILGIPYFS